MYISKAVERNIKDSWTVALDEAIKHTAEYCELNAGEEISQEHIDEFMNTIISYRKAQMKSLLKADKKYFAYISKDFESFASYDGTECRTIYRAFFAMRGYRSFAYAFGSKTGDSHSFRFAFDNYLSIR